MPFKELLNKPNTITALELWKEKYHNHFLKISKQSSCSVRCGKLMANEFVFPCVCKEREKACFLTQFYYEVNNIIELQGYDFDCEEAVLDSFRLSRNEKEYTLWLNSYKDLFYKIKKSKKFEVKSDNPQIKYYKVEVIISQISQDFFDLYNQISKIDFPPEIIPFEFLQANPLCEYPKSYLKSIKHLGKFLSNGKYLNVYLRNSMHYFNDMHYKQKHISIYNALYLSSPKFICHKTVLKSVEYSFENTDFDNIKMNLKRDVQLLKPINIKTISKKGIFEIFYLDSIIKLFKKDCNTIVLSVSKNEK